MFEQLQTVLVNVVADPLPAVISALALLFLFMLWKESREENLDWRDLITSKGTNKVSLTKMLQLVGGVTGTWIMVYITLHAQLTAEIFFTYLAYVGAIDGWSKFVSAKYGGFTGGDDKPKPKPPTKPDPAPKPPVGDDVN